MNIKSRFLPLGVAFNQWKSWLLQDRKSDLYYPDIRLFLILIPVINCFNYYLTYINIRFNWKFVLTFSIDVIQGYLAWMAVRTIILYLDRRLPYSRGALKRITVQVLTTTVTGLVIIALLTEMVSLIARGRPAIPSFYTFDLVIISIWFFVLNGIYIGMFYYRQWEHVVKNRMDGRDEADIMVTYGRSNLKFKPAEILGFWVEDGYVSVCHRDGKRYLTNDSLDKLEKHLPSERFFRLNRQYLIHKDLVNGFRRGDNGKLEVLISETNIFPSVIPVSRLKASSFREWFDSR